MGATLKQRREQAAAIARIAQSIADGTLIGPEQGAVRRLSDLVETLRAWTPEDRSDFVGEAF